MMALIELEGITREFGGKKVLKETSLEVSRGEALALIGPTGSGKTTMLRLMDLLDFPSSGKIRFDGIDVTRNQHQRQAARRRMAFVQQKPIVFTMSVFDNVASGLRWRHQKDAEVRRKVDDALSLVGLEDYRNRQAKTLSGGETQRVAIARALVTAPEVLFLDEPTANLDPLSTSRIEAAVASVLHGKTTAVVMATHDMVQGQRLASRVAVLLNGQIRQVGTPGEIFSSPESQEVAEFVEIGNILPGITVGREANLLTVKVNGRPVQAVASREVAEEVSVLVRPEDVVLSLSPGKSSARNTFEGTVTSFHTMGPLVRIELDCGFSLFGVLTRSSAQELDLHTGKKIFASFKATAAHVTPRLS
ncbi:MAG: ABC transporter ATP-binding protein [Chloroflexota bacterium]